MYILFALIAACAFALSSVLKHRSAQDLAQLDDGSRSRGPLGIIAYSVRHRLWLAGIVADTLALGFQIVALHLGPIAVVQPLLITSLVLAFLVSRRGRLRIQELVWPVTVVLALGMLSLVSAAPTSTATADVLPSAIGITITGLVIAIGLRLVGNPLRRVRPPLVLGVGVGVIYAATAALLKTLSDFATRGGLTAVLGSWELYAVLVAGAAGLVLNQAAFRAGPLHQSLPAISVVDPIASIGVGVVIYDERLRHGALGVLVLVVAVVVLAVATIRLSRLESLASESRALVPTAA